MTCAHCRKEGPTRLYPAGNLCPECAPPPPPVPDPERTAEALREAMLARLRTSTDA